MTKFSPASRPLQSPQLRHHGTQQPIALKIVHLLFQQRLCQRQKRNHQMNLLLMKRLSLSGPACMLSRVRLRAIAWTVDRQAPLSMGSSRQEYWSGLLCPPAGNLPDPERNPRPSCPAFAGRFFTTSTTCTPPVLYSEKSINKPCCDSFR